VLVVNRCDFVCSELYSTKEYGDFIALQSQPFSGTSFKTRTQKKNRKIGKSSLSDTWNIICTCNYYCVLLFIGGSFLLAFEIQFHCNTVQRIR
jgi:hypothetical protein